MKDKTKKTKRVMVSSAMDKEGNILSKWSDGSITLRLASEGGRVRQLGYVEGDTFYTSRKFSHLHKLTKSYGFNYLVIKKGVSFQYVMLTLEDDNSYKIPKDVILNMGRVMYFKTTDTGESFELQIFLPTNIIYQYKV
jgi:hypothetical protein